MKVALVHDWLTGMRGGERCLEALCELFPAADLFTLLHIQGSVSPTIEGRRIRTSFIQNLPCVEKKYRYYLPLFPRAIETFDLRGYDLILSSSHCVAKGARRPAGSLHVSYIFTPMRYAWDLYEEYFGRDRLDPLRGFVVDRVCRYLRAWDVKSNVRVDHFIAISRHVAERMNTHYGRDATVIYPPVDTDLFRPGSGEGNYYLVVSALSPYKRIDLAISACNRLARPLKIVGTGPEERRLRALAGPTVEFLGWKADSELADLYAGCRAVIFPGEEDFGIVPLEAQACGRPVIALGKGGVVETIVPLNGPRSEVPGPTGVFSCDQTVEAVVEAVKLFEANVHRFDQKVLRDHAVQFDRRIFKEKMRAFLDRAVHEWRRGRGARSC